MLEDISSTFGEASKEINDDHNPLILGGQGDFNASLCPNGGSCKDHGSPNMIFVCCMKVYRSKLGHGEDDNILDAWEESPTMLCRIYFIDVLEWYQS